MKYIKWLLFDLASSSAVVLVLFAVTFLCLFFGLKILWIWQSMAFLYSAMLCSLTINILNSEYLSTYKHMKREALQNGRKHKAEDGEAEHDL